MREIIFWIVVVWTLLATIVGWGSYVFAKRDPCSTSWTKITFAAVPLAIFGLIAICLFLLPSDILVPTGTLPSGLLVPGMLIFFWAMAAVGAPLCIGCIMGILLGMYRRQH
jgi:hypothetical protein